MPFLRVALNTPLSESNFVHPPEKEVVEPENRFTLSFFFAVCETCIADESVFTPHMSTA